MTPTTNQSESNPGQHNSNVVSRFLEKEEEELRNIEKLAANTKFISRKSSKDTKCIDWDQWEKVLLTPGVVNLNEDLEDKEFQFLIDMYNKEPDSPVLREKEEKARIVREHRRNSSEKALEKARKEAAEYLNMVAAEEEEDYKLGQKRLEEYFLTIIVGRERKCKPKQWTIQEKQLDDYKRVLEVYKQIKNAQKPQRVIEILESMSEETTLPIFS